MRINFLKSHRSLYVGLLRNPGHLAGKRVLILGRTEVTGNMTVVLIDEAGGHDVGDIIIVPASDLQILR